MWSSGTQLKSSDFVLCTEEKKKVNLKPLPFFSHRSSMCFFQSHFQILHIQCSLKWSGGERKEGKPGILPTKSVRKLFQGSLPRARRAVDQLLRDGEWSRDFENHWHPKRDNTVQQLSALALNWAFWIQARGPPLPAYFGQVIHALFPYKLRL